MENKLENFQKLIIDEKYLDAIKILKAIEYYDINKKCDIKYPLFGEIREMPELEYCKDLKSFKRFWLLYCLIMENLKKTKNQTYSELLLNILMNYSNSNDKDILKLIEVKV